MPLHRIGSTLVNGFRATFGREAPRILSGCATWADEFRRALGASRRFETLHRERAARDALGIGVDDVARQVFTEYYAGPRRGAEAGGTDGSRPVTGRAPGESGRARRSFPQAGRAPSVR